MIYGERWNRVAEADNLVSEKDGLSLRQSFKKRKALIINNEKKLQEKREDSIFKCCAVMLEKIKLSQSATFYHYGFRKLAE